MSVFIGEKGKRVELAERKDATNPNYLTGSRGFDGWVVRNEDITSDSYNGGKVISLHTGGDGDNAVSTSPQPTASQTVTWSVYAKATNDGDRLHTELWGGNGLTEQPLTTDWHRYTFTGTFNPTNRTLYFWGVGGNKGDVQIALPKLEIGTVATPWCPAIEDYAMKSDADKTHTDLQNTINQQAQTIQSLTTRLTNVENEISYIKANYVEGKQFPASQEAQAIAWEKANPQGIAFITSN